MYKVAPVTERVLPRRVAATTSASRRGGYFFWIRHYNQFDINGVRRYNVVVYVYVYAVLYEGISESTCTFGSTNNRTKVLSYVGTSGSTEVLSYNVVRVVVLPEVRTKKLCTRVASYLSIYLASS